MELAVNWNNGEHCTAWYHTKCFWCTSELSEKRMSLYIQRSSMSMFHFITYKFIQTYENLVTLRETVPSYTSFSVCKSNEVNWFIQYLIHTVISQGTTDGHFYLQLRTATFSFIVTEKIYEVSWIGILKDTAVIKTWVARDLRFIVNPKIIKLSSFRIQQLPFTWERNVPGRCTSTVCNFILNILFHFLLSICGSLSQCWEGTGTLWVTRPMWFTISGHEQESWRSTTLNINARILSTIIYFYLLKCQHPIQWVWGEDLSIGGGGPKADHSSGSSSEVKSKWSHTSSPHIAFLECIGTVYEQLYFFSPHWTVWTNWAFFKC
jgi:hypothetical protein